MDLGLHLAWAEWLRSGFGPAAEPGYPLGPHGLAVATASVPGIGLGQAFLGEIIAIGAMTGLTALGALRKLTPRQRTVLVLRYFEDLTEVQTASALGISSGAVKSMSRDALRRLRDLAPELADLVGADA